MSHGATPEDWAHFSALLGLTPDLLPVVSNPNARASPKSSLKTVGKVPSVYGSDGVYGLAKWTSRITDTDDIAQWAKQPDYGICIQTRDVRAIDVDIGDAAAAAQVLRTLGTSRQLPRRCRPNSSKFLAAFRLPGEYGKRIIKTAHGAIEFLATGQQFVAVGTHPSGVRYEWAGGLPDEIPTLSAEEFEALWASLVNRFATEAPTEETPSNKATVIAEAQNRDPVAQHLLSSGWVKSTERDGRLHIRCPFEDEHTSESTDSATTYWPAHTGGYELGHFKCLHAHCSHRTDDDFKLAAGFDDLGFGVVGEGATTPGERFKPKSVAEFVTNPLATRYHIKGVIDRVSLGVLYGESTAGKTFVALDFAYHISQGIPWRGHRVTQGKVVYICCEGLGGLNRRLSALRDYHGVKDITNLSVITDTPNLLGGDHKALAAQIVAYGGADLVFVDTASRAMAGGDENSAEVMTKVISHADAIHKATGATVVFVAHAGKDQSKGVRGHSSLKAAADMQIEVRREGEGASTQRFLRLEKVKDGDGEGRVYGFRLETVNLGDDADGDRVTSCVVREAAAVQPNANKGSRAKLVMSVLNDAAELGAGLPGDELIRRVVEQLPPPGSGQRDQRAANVRLTVEKLTADGVVKWENGQLLLVKNDELSL